MSVCSRLGEMRRVICESLGDDTLAAIDAHVRDCPDCQDELPKLAQDLRWAPSRPADPLPEEGTFPPIDGFAFERELGRGGMGVVYLARKEALRSRPVALKVVPRAPGRSDAERRQWRDEAQALSLVSHPQVVTLFDAGETPAWRFLVLEYISGGSLEDRPRGPLPPRTAATLLAKIADGVAAIHRAGLVHLDLKPPNILLDCEPGTPLDRANPRVSDFGIARLLADPALAGDDPRTTNLRAGTPSFMAPEQVRADRLRIGPATDIHALGAILYELLTGRPPFEGPSPTETMAHILEQEPVPPRRLIPRIPRDLETIALKCLEKDPSRRYASAGALADDLRRWLDGRPIAARPVSRPERAWRWCRRRPAVAALVVTLLLALWGGSFGMFLLWRKAESERGRAESERVRAGAAQARAEADLQRAAELLGRLVELNVGGRYSLPKVVTREDKISLLQLTRRNLLDLADRLPNREAMLLQLYLVNTRLGVTLAQESREDEARHVFECSLREAEDALRRFPDSSLPRGWLIDSLDQLAQLADRGKRPEEVEAFRARAISGAEEVFRAAPRVDALVTLLYHRRALTRMLADQGRRAEAKALILANRRAIEESPCQGGDERIVIEYLLNAIDSWHFGIHSSLGPRIDGDRPPDALAMLGSPEADRLPAEAWAELALRALRLAEKMCSVTLPESKSALRLTHALHDTASEQRSGRRLVPARQTADRMLALARLVVERNPEDSDAHLAVAVAYDEVCKNAWQVNDRATIARYLRLAIESNRRALEFSPDDERARATLESREQKLNDLPHPRSELGKEQASRGPDERSAAR
jgi:serine/threonine protein kinase